MIVSKFAVLLKNLPHIECKFAAVRAFTLKGKFAKSSANLHVEVEARTAANLTVDIFDNPSTPNTVYEMETNFQRILSLSM